MKNNNKVYYYRNNNQSNKEYKLFLNRVENYFYNILLNNCNDSYYDSALGDLHTIMKMTFEKSNTRINVNLINKFNGNYRECSGSYVIIAKGKYSAEDWLKLYIYCLPNIPLPEYNKKWVAHIQWAYKNVLEGIDAIEKSKSIKETKTINEKTGHAELDHDEYKALRANMNNIRATTMQLIDNIITNSSLDKIESIKEQCILPNFINNDDDVYRFYAIRLIWSMITLRANYINYGQDLNDFTVLINYSEKYPKEKYLNAMKILREHNNLEKKYGLKLCLLIAKLIELTYNYNYKHNNVITYITTSSALIIDYLISYNNNSRKFMQVSSPIEKEIKLIVNRLNINNTDETVELLNTYTKEDREKHLLSIIINHPDISFELFLLLYKFFSEKQILQSVIGGLRGRRIDSQEKEIEYLIRLNIITLEEIYNRKLLSGDSFMSVVIKLYKLEIINNNVFFKKIKNELLPKLSEPSSIFYLNKLTKD